MSTEYPLLLKTEVPIFLKNVAAEIAEKIASANSIPTSTVVQDAIMVPASPPAPQDDIEESIQSLIDGILANRKQQIRDRCKDGVYTSDMDSPTLTATEANTLQDLVERWGTSKTTPTLEAARKYLQQSPRQVTVSSPDRTNVPQVPISVLRHSVLQLLSDVNAKIRLPEPLWYLLDQLQHRVKTGSVSVTTFIVDQTEALAQLCDSQEDLTWRTTPRGQDDIQLDTSSQADGASPSRKRTTTMRCPLPRSSTLVIGDKPFTPAHVSQPSVRTSGSLRVTTMRSVDTHVEYAPSLAEFQGLQRNTEPILNILQVHIIVVALETRTDNYGSYIQYFGSKAKFDMIRDIVGNDRTFINAYWKGLTKYLLTYYMTNDHSVPSPPKCVNAAHGCPCVAFNLIGEACCKTCSDGKICLYATTHDDSPHRALANQYVKDPATYDQVRIFDVTFPTCKVQYCQSVIADCNQERCIYHIVQPTSYHEPSQGWPTCITVGCGCVGYRGREGDVCSKSCRERGPCKSVYHPFPSGLREHRHKQVQKRVQKLTNNVPSPDRATRAARLNSPTKGSIVKPVLQKLAVSFERCPLHKFNCPTAAEYSQLRDNAQQLAYGGLSLLPTDHDADTRWQTVCELVISQPFRLTSVQMLEAVNEMAQLILRRLPDDWSESTRLAYKILSLSL